MILDTLTLDITKIMKILPHRFPMLLVDKVLSYNKKNEVITLKNVTINESYFTGHFPKFPITPGVLMIESMAQSAAILAVLQHGINPNDEGFKEREIDIRFISIEKAKFRKPVLPGDTMIIKTINEKFRQNSLINKFSSEIKVEDKVVAECILTAMFIDN